MVDVLLAGDDDAGTVLGGSRGGLEGNTKGFAAGTGGCLVAADLGCGQIWKCGMGGIDGEDTFRTRQFSHWDSQRSGRAG